MASLAAAEAQAEITNFRKLSLPNYGVPNEFHTCDQSVRAGVSQEVPKFCPLLANSAS
jgi:hypothetical protein